MDKKACIVANGQLSNNQINLKILKESDLVIACDGAYDKLKLLGMVPDYIIGDMDSIQNIEQVESSIKLIKLADQNTNDLQKALALCEKLEFKEIQIIGISGLMDDHMLANIFILMQYPHLKLCAWTDYGKFSPIWGRTEFESFCGQKVSLFATDPNLQITSHNLQYPLDKMMLPHLNSGSLNVSLYNKFTIDIQNGCLLVYQAHRA